MADRTKVLVDRDALLDLRNNIIACADKIEAALAKIDKDADDLADVWETESGQDEKYFWKHLDNGLEQAQKDSARLRSFAESLKSAASEYTDMDLDIKQKVIIMNSKIVETSISKNS